MHNLYLLPNDYISEDWEKGEDGWKGRSSIDDQEWYMVDFKSVRKVSYTCPPFVCMRYNDDLMASIYELRRELVYVALHSSGLREEEVADHGNIVRHFD